jgi:site-specific recombinase XerD
MVQGPGERGQLQDVAARETHSIYRLAQRWTGELLNAGRSRLTIRMYESVVNSFHGWLSSVGIYFLDVTRQDAQQWLTELRMSGKKEVTIRGYLVVMRGLYRWLCANDYIAKDPFTCIISVRVPRKIPETMTVKEVDRMAKACRTPRELAIVETLYSTGCRRAELLGMRLQDLDFDQGRVKVTGKGNKDRYCYLSRRAIHALKKWLNVRSQMDALKRHPTELLFIGNMGPMHACWLGLMIHKIRARAKITKRVTPHGFRHSHATHLRDAGANIEDIADVLGHEDMRTSQIYAKTSTVKIRQTWVKLPR